MRPNDPGVPIVDAWAPGSPASRSTGPGTFTFYTVGHAAHPIGEFEALLETFGVGVLADVRLAPGSRHSPQFNGDALAASLRSAGIRYVHLPELGGWRTARKGSPNGGWTNRSFQGYADHMATPEFERGMGRLLAAAAALCDPTSTDPDPAAALRRPVGPERDTAPTAHASAGADPVAAALPGSLTPSSHSEGGSVACMCAEGLWWRCHRRLLSDALVARGHTVVHILPDGRQEPHSLTAGIVVRGLHLTYPPQQPTLGI